MRLLVLLAFVTAQILAPSGLSRGVAQNQSPTLTETVEWLKAKADAVTAIERPSARITVLQDSPRSWELIYSGGCTLVWKNITPDPKSYPQMSVSFSLTDLNPEKVKHYERNADIMDAGSIDLYATAGKKIFRWQITTQNRTYDSGGIFSGPRMKLKTETTNPVANRLQLSIRNSDMTRRMAKAFQHAITLCGGKVDPKEPF